MTTVLHDEPDSSSLYIKKYGVEKRMELDLFL